MRRYVLPLVIGLIIIGTALSRWVLMNFYTRFDDMAARGDAFVLPEGYSLVSKSAEGGNPPFFGGYPRLTYEYTTRRDWQRACDDIRDLVYSTGGLMSEKVEGRFCLFSVPIRAGWKATVLGGWNYSLSMQATEENGRVRIFKVVSE